MIEDLISINEEEQTVKDVNQVFHGKIICLGVFAKGTPLVDPGHLSLLQVFQDHDHHDGVVNKLVYLFETEPEIVLVNVNDCLLFLL